MKEKIKEISSQFEIAIKKFEEENISSRIKSFEMDCNKLNFDFDNIDICEDPYFKEMFDELKLVTDYPTVYWFEFDTNKHSSEHLFNIFKNYKENITKRNPPAIYKYFRNTNILYIGKSKSCLWGRLLLHLGFHRDKHSQGLILNEWAHNIDLKLKFNYCVFNREMVDLIALYELKLAQNNKPLIGKHQ
ncbi:hypothetical protein C3B47_14050 [Flavobacterium columnare]|uniref:hypothetical protein n=1 Tax=Flavobacterium columnare TaxID=996 RepID=UPI0018966170|nr:hypothetical protein [Flavobacterium columnare]MBF6653977.1 hypothetical protein [Flavobacterium columnare]